MQPFDRIDDPVRLRQLVKAILILDAELHLPVVLRRIVEEARDLVNAHYGALGVLSEDGETLEQLVTAGLSSDEELAIETRPTGRGLLGTVIADDRPVRLADDVCDPVGADGRTSYSLAGDASHYTPVIDGRPAP